MEKLVITIAPTGNVPTKDRTPYVPVTPAEIAESVYECYKAGASVAHIHARDETGRPTYRKEVFKEIVDRIKEKCDIIIQLSTGARAGRTAEERGECITLAPEMASLTTGSSNFPTMANLNAPDLIEYLCKQMQAYNVVPEIEVFDTAMIANALALQKKGLLSEPLRFNLVMGVPGSIPASFKNLFFLVESLPAGAYWTCTSVGPLHPNLSMMAMAMGGNVRTGIEDNIYYEKGVLATNPMLVERVVKMAQALGREVASVKEAREILKLNRGEDSK
ncbi:MAG TPA: 3-keto-5-aminohexanoate cleavage protein [Firmicutes bacterium]|nr:3-keto-5-aminohexanoate cleavage protein [Bacillota bacterium]